jgi:preprotein translocase subunit SecF
MTKHDRKKELRLKHLLKHEKESKEEAVPEHHHHTEKKHTGIRGFYENRMKILLGITLTLLLLSIIQIAVQTITTGEFIHKDVSLKGGITISMQAESAIDAVELQNFLSTTFKGTSIDVRNIKSYGKITGLIIDSDINKDKTEEFINLISLKTGIDRKEFSIDEMGGALGASFFRQTITAIIAAFICMSIVVFIYFKSAGPSIIVITCAFADIVETIAAVNILGINVSTGGIAALLMLVGYSVNTDMLLSTRVLKRKENTFMENTYSSMATGLTMTLTTITAVVAGIIISVSPVIKQIMTILLIGLIFDIINTWLQNVALLRLYLERGKKHVKA